MTKDNPNSQHRQNISTTDAEVHLVSSHERPHHDYIQWEHSVLSAIVGKSVDITKLQSVLSATVRHVC